VIPDKRKGVSLSQKYCADRKEIGRISAKFS
jgi:hypothetical protein